MSQHVVPRSVYFTIFGALLALTGLTIWVAFHDLNWLNTIIAMTIAVGKATLVVLYFMHLRYSGRLIMVVAGSGLVWLIILMALTLGDYFTRTPAV